MRPTPGTDQAARFLELSGTLSARLDADDRKLLEELIMIVAPPMTTGSIDEFRQRLIDLIGPAVPRLPAANVITELLANAVTVAKRAQLPVYSFCDLAALIWSEANLIGAELIWLEIANARAAALKARGPMPPQGPAN